MKKYVIILFLCNCTFSFAQSFPFGNVTKTDSLLKQLTIYGNDDLDIINELYSNDKSLTDDSINSLLRISNLNYSKNKNIADTSIDFQFRYIYVCDQTYRIKCYIHKLIDYNVVQINDSTLQALFLSITDNKNVNILGNLCYQQTFLLLLMHSVTTLQTHFFVNNFHVYASAFSNNFKDYNMLKSLLDLYLNHKFNKQYFNTEYGKGRLADNSFGLLPTLSDKELKETMTELKIYNAVY